VRSGILLILLFLIAGPALALEYATIETNMGTIKLELDGEKAPTTVRNFFQYAEDGFYDGTIFHRVIGDFMIQGGGFTADLKQKATRAPIKNEADNGLKNSRGTIAMARTSVVDSATGQFFINLKDNSFLDFRSKTPRGYGYAVFGRVVEGMEVVDKIGRLPTRSKGMMQNMPVETVTINSIRKITP